MKRIIGASAIALICLSVLAGHAWLTWGDAGVGSAAGQDERDFFQYSLFLESFAFMVSAAYFFGPRIYRLLNEEWSARRFEGEKKNVSGLVQTYAAAAVVLRRISFDPRMGVPWYETVAVIAVICAPALLTMLKKKQARRADSQRTDLPAALKCGQCGALNTVARCPSCGRPFVVVRSHLEHRVRRFEDGPLNPAPPELPVIECDFCAERRAGRLKEAVEGGLRQRTCGACHTEFLSEHQL